MGFGSITLDLKKITNIYGFCVFLRKSYFVKWIFFKIVWDVFTLTTFLKIIIVQVLLKFSLYFQ
jgi:hypothetical protein